MLIVWQAVCILLTIKTHFMCISCWGRNLKSQTFAFLFMLFQSHPWVVFNSLLIWSVHSLLRKQFPWGPFLIRFSKRDEESECKSLKASNETVLMPVMRPFMSWVFLQCSATEAALTSLKCLSRVEKLLQLIRQREGICSAQRRKHPRLKNEASSC